MPTMDSLRGILIPLKADPKGKAQVVFMLEKYAPKTGKLSEVQTSDYPALMRSAKELQQKLADEDLPFEGGRGK